MKIPLDMEQRASGVAGRLLQPRRRSSGGAARSHGDGVDRGRRRARARRAAARARPRRAAARRRVAGGGGRSSGCHRAEFSDILKIMCRILHAYSFCGRMCVRKNARVCCRCRQALSTEQLFTSIIIGILRSAGYCVLQLSMFYLSPYFPPPRVLQLSKELSLEALGVPALSAAARVRVATVTVTPLTPERRATWAKVSLPSREISGHIFRIESSAQRS